MLIGGTGTGKSYLVGDLLSIRDIQWPGDLDPDADIPGTGARPEGERFGASNRRQARWARKLACPGGNLLGPAHGVRRERAGRLVRTLRVIRGQRPL